MSGPFLIKLIFLEFKFIHFLTFEENAFFGEKYSEKDELLLYSIIDTLSNVFKNDSQKSFANKDCFKLLIQPLVDQVNLETLFFKFWRFLFKQI